jgi:hypothetical protein
MRLATKFPMILTEIMPIVVYLCEKSLITLDPGIIHIKLFLP